MAKLGLHARADLHPGRAARPPRGAAVRDRACRRRAWSASRPRSGTCSAPRCARSRSRSGRARRARARCRTSATRSSASGSAASPASCAATPRSGWRTSRSGTSATSRTPRAERIVLPDSTILLDQVLALTLRVVRGMTVHADRMLRQPRDHVRRAVLPARAARARRRRDAARRRVPDRPAARPAGVGHADAAARRCSSSENVDIDLDEVFDYGYYVRHVPTVLARLEVIPSPS